MEPLNKFQSAKNSRVFSMARPAERGRKGTYSDVPYRLISGEELFERGFSRVLADLRDCTADRPVFLCFEMDFFDPSCAPGVCTRTWGGASAREGLGLLKGWAGLRLVGFEVNTVSPPHEIGGLTASLAAEVVRQFLLLACKSPGMKGC